jgi:hypothetical protein
MEVAFVHRLLVVEKNLADKIAFIATDYIRIVFGHLRTTFCGERLILPLFSSECTTVVYLGGGDIWPIVATPGGKERREKLGIRNQNYGLRPHDTGFDFRLPNHIVRFQGLHTDLPFQR